MKKAQYIIYHRAEYRCPNCGEFYSKDLGESDEYNEAVGTKITCRCCKTVFEIEGEIEDE